MSDFPQRSDEVVLKYGTDNVGEIQSLSMNVAGNEIPANSFDSGLFEKYIRGRLGVTLSVTCILDDTDAGQTALLADMLDDEKIRPNQFDNFSIGKREPTAGDVVYSGAGFPTSFSDEGGDDGDGLRTRTFEIRISGEWARTVTS